MEERQKIINQTRYETLARKEFPEDCLSDAYVDGVVFTELPENLEIWNTRFVECRFSNISVESLNFTDCVIADGIFSGIKADEVNLQGTTVYGTLITDFSVAKMNMERATFRKSSMRDGDMLELNLTDATLESMYFYRIKSSKVKGIEQANMTMGGATNEEVENYRRQVQDALIQKKNMRIKHDKR